MNDEEIAAIVTKLEEATHEMNCTVSIVRNGDDISESHVLGTRGGYLKLASLCLRVITSKGYETAEPIDVELSDLLHDDSDVWLTGFDCDETLRKPEYVARQLSMREKVTSAASGISCLVFALLILASVSVGSFVILEALAKLWF